MRQFFHVVVALGCWVLLAAFWVALAVEGKATGPALRDTAFEVAALTGVVFAVTMWWVRHNVGIYNRKGPREGRPALPPPTDVDRLGRRLRWAMPGGARTAASQQHLVIELAAETKIYRRAD